MAVYVTEEPSSFREVRDDPKKWVKLFQQTMPKNYGPDYTELHLNESVNAHTGPPCLLPRLALPCAFYLDPAECHEAP